MTVRRPNLFIIGAMKSGTTYLHHLLAQHPAIFMSPSKEPNYFVDGRPLRLTRKRVYARFGTDERRDAYLELFQGARDEVYLGESSTAYSKQPRFTDVTPRIEAFVEDPRFIYIMRDPVERAISQYWHSVANSGERRPLLTAVSENRSYRNVSDYTRQLRPYLERFGRDRLYTTTFEEFTADPMKALKRIWRWLEIEESFAPPEMEAKKHIRSEVVFQNTPLFDLKKLKKLNAKTLKSQRLKVTIKRLNRSSNILKKKLNKSDEDTEDAKEYLRSIMLKQVNQLEKLLERDFPEWKTLYGPSRDAAESEPMQAAGALHEI